MPNCLRENETIQAFTRSAEVSRPRRNRRPKVSRNGKTLGDSGDLRSKLVRGRETLAQRGCPSSGSKVDGIGLAPGG